MLVTIEVLVGCVKENVDINTNNNIDDDAGIDFDEILDVTVYKTTIDFLYCTNQIKYKIDFPINYSECNYLIGKKMSIYVKNVDYSPYGNHEKFNDGLWRVVKDDKVKYYEVIRENITIRSAYDEHISYVANLSYFEKLEVTGDMIIELPVLDRYGRNIHYIKEFEITIHNPCNISTYLKTNFSYYNCDTNLAVSQLPTDIDNRYFVLTYPENIIVEPHETVCYMFTIEIYGSSDQLFFPKEYQIDFTLHNKWATKTFSLGVSLSEYD